jgi:hypothetical protein
MQKPSGYVLYRGPSLLDGAPIVAIATLTSDNRKTGNMLQTWILREDMSPVAASKAGADASICGECPQRHSLGGACYVNIGQAPGSVWRAYKRGAYPSAEFYLAREAQGAGRKVRLGAYGDPAAVPLNVWQDLLRYATGWTGYTHQWRIAPAYRAYCMASVDNDAERATAHAMGWRTFRVTESAETVGDREFVCVSESKGTACADCLACNGRNPQKFAGSVVITVHGARKARFQSATL